MIDVKNLYHDYQGKGQYAVKDVSFSIERGQIFGFLGPSGAGKSTVQNLMTGLLRVQKGSILYEGVSIGGMGPKFFNSVGYSFELPNIYGRLSGFENLKYFAGLFDVPTADPLRLLDMVGLTSAAHKPAGSYSKGMKQRLVFARAIINNPRILFLDEPTSGLDPSTAAVIKDLIRAQKQKGATIFLTTHTMADADELCDTVAFINDGSVVAMDTPRSLKLAFGEKSVRVEYRENGTPRDEILFFEKADDRARLAELSSRAAIETMHTREATLEQIFMRLTGRGLS